MLFILRFLMGYSRIEAKGVFLERFLNLLSRDNIRIWDLERRDGFTVAFCCRPGDREAIRKTAAKTETDIKAVALYGVLPTAARYKKRIGLAAGALLFAFILFVLGGHIWTVKIEGNFALSDETILHELSEAGFHKGMRKKDLDIDYVRHTVLQNCHDLSFIMINLSGVTAEIIVGEGVQAPQIEDGKTPCNIVAAVDGQITRVMCYRGEPQVHVGDAVVKGQLLISGVSESAEAGTRYLASSGEIYAKVDAPWSVTVLLKEEVFERTGSQKTRKTVRFGDISINLFVNSGIGYETYDNIKSEKDVIIFGAKTPFSIASETYFETEKKTVERTPDEAAAAARDMLDAYVEQKSKTCGVLGVSSDMSTDRDGVTLKARIECEENIAQRQLIQTEEVN